MKAHIDMCYMGDRQTMAELSVCHELSHMMFHWALMIALRPKASISWLRGRAGAR